MNIEYTINTNTILAQAYGMGSYNEEVYSSCEITADGCIPVTAAAPNTGFLGLSPDAAIASASGALLVAIAIAGAVYVFASRARKKKAAKE